MSLIPESKKDKIVTGNILTFGAKAAAHKKADPTVINATVGMLNGEDGEFYVFDSIKKAREMTTDYMSFSYPSTKGSNEFRDAIKTWLFGDTISTFEKEGFYIDTIASPGGSGAISNVFDNCLEDGEKVILPRYMWEMYILFAKERRHDYITYDLYDECGNFNIPSVKNAIDTLAKTQSRIVLVLNDPCQNPTGMCLKDNEYDELIDLINSYDIPFTLLMDTAYYDYYNTDGSIIRNRYAKLAKLTKANIVFAVSGSKSLGLYGLRIGASVICTRSEADYKEFLNAFEFTARTNWSCPSRLGESIMTTCLSNPALMGDFYNELKTTSAMLLERANAFTEEAKKYDLPILPYEAGFFIVVKCNKQKELIEKLVENKVYAIALSFGAIRIALCSINKEEARALPKIIAKCMKEVE